MLRSVWLEVKQFRNIEGEVLTGFSCICVLGRLTERSHRLRFRRASPCLWVAGRTRRDHEMFLSSYAAAFTIEECLADGPRSGRT